MVPLGGLGRRAHASCCRPRNAPSAPAPPSAAPSAPPSAPPAALPAPARQRTPPQARLTCAERGAALELLRAEYARLLAVLQGPARRGGAVASLRRELRREQARARHGLHHGSHHGLHDGYLITGLIMSLVERA